MRSVGLWVDFRKVLDLFHSVDFALMRLWPPGTAIDCGGSEDASQSRGRIGFIFIASVLLHWTERPPWALVSLRAKREVIEAALRENGGWVSGPTGAAVKLGLPGSTLQSKIRSLKIDKHRFKRPNPQSIACRSLPQPAPTLQIATFANLRKSQFAISAKPQILNGLASAR